MSAVRNIEAEAVVLGAMMTNNRCIDRMADRLVADDFYESIHGRIFDAILKEASQGRAANPVTLKPYLEGDEGLKELGGVGYLAKLTGSLSIIGGDTCADQVREMAQRRRLIEGLNEAATMAADMDQTNEQVISAADAAISPVSDLGEGVVQISAAKAFEQMLSDYDQPKTGVTSGGRVKALDDVLGPIRKHHLDILAGRPGMGKTAAALSYSIGAAMAGHGVLYVSREMHRIELMQRMTADVCFDQRSGNGIPYEAIRDGHFTTDSARKRVYEASRVFGSLPLHIVDAAHLTVGRLNMIVRRYKRRMAALGHNLELVVVDYLQLMEPDHRTNSTNDRVAAVSTGLKSIAKGNDVGVLALAQLSRKVEERENKRPMLSDLRDSGQIEQDADAVIFLYRDEYYLRKGKPDETDPKFPAWQMALEKVQGRIDFIVAKRRNGPEGTGVGQFYGAYQAVRGEDL